MYKQSSVGEHMTGQPDPNEHGILQGGVRTWLLCVVIAAAPLAFYLVILELFTVENIATFWRGRVGQQLFSPAAEAHMGTAYFGYATHFFVHTLVCMAVGAYFCWKLANTRIFQEAMIACLVLGLVVIAAVYLVTSTDTAFRDHMVEPILNVLIALKPPLPRPFVAAGPDVFLVWGLVTPVAFGVIAVLLATCSFHATLFFPKEKLATGDKQTARAFAKLLRRDVTVLSLVLVTAVMTARSYLTMTGHVFDADPSAQLTAATMRELAHSLSASAGVLFSVTLIASFAPGFVACMAKRHELFGGSKISLREVFSESNAQGSGKQGIGGVMQIFFALIAPAISSPLFDVMVTAVGA